MWYFVVFLISFPIIIDGGDQIMERMQSCCEYGTEFAYNALSEDCSSAKVPYDISIFCNHVSEQCCQEYNIKKAICEKGIELAKTSHLSMSLNESLEKVNESIQQSCFDQCKLGAVMGKSYAITACNVTPLRKSPELLLFSNAFSQCCKAAATDSHDSLKSKPNTSAGKDITHAIVSSMPSMCEEFAPHELCTHHCIPVPGSYKCECNPGFELMSDGQSCIEVEKNSCDSHNTCQHECIKNGMENKCSCRKGYQLMTDKTSCEDINECDLGIHDCDKYGAQYQCSNIPGSYRCVKRVNIISTPSSKVEAAEFYGTTSEIINPTPTVVVPPQTASIYFTSDIMTNSSQLLTLLEKPDIDECAEGTHLCDQNQNCFNTNGSYECYCKQGFKLASTTVFEVCVDIDECVEGTHLCDQNQNCFNTNGSYECHCKQGFELKSTIEVCVDIDECATGEALCGPLQVCTNLPGGYNCSCPEGHKLFGDHLCEDVDECVSVESESICSQNAECINTVGSYQCRCHKGFETAPDNDKVCVDVDECTKFKHSNLCMGLCLNEPGSYRCSCPSGYILSEDKRSCIDIDECAEGTHLCDQNQNCFNTNGSYECHCKQGFEKSTIEVCVDIDECATGEALCGPLQVCTNLPGGYNCSCPEGHKLFGDHLCEDVDECVSVESESICSQNAECINTVGSYQCRCHKGFETAPDNDKVCVDVDECTKFKHSNLCMGLCLNEPGSYRCSCPSGYILSEDKRSCIDIDECETGEAPCASVDQSGGSSVVCLNIRGGYRCQNITCPPGYYLEGRHRCNKKLTSCRSTDYACLHQPSTYSYNYITFVSNLSIPESKVDLFTIKGPSWPHAMIKFELRIVDVDAPPSVKDKADTYAFMLNPTDNKAVISLVRPLEGPQSIELELSTEVYNREMFGGIAVSKLYIYVSEYEF